MKLSIRWNKFYTWCKVPERPNMWYIFEKRIRWIIYVSSVYRQCIISASSVHHCSVFIAELSPVYCCQVSDLVLYHLTNLSQSIFEIDRKVVFSCCSLTIYLPTSYFIYIQDQVYFYQSLNIIDRERIIDFKFFAWNQSFASLFNQSSVWKLCLRCILKVLRLINIALTA